MHLKNKAENEEEKERCSEAINSQQRGLKNDVAFKVS